MFCISPHLNEDCLEHSMLFLQGAEVASKYLVEKCTPKEKELKKDARWFSQQTTPERIRRQIMEKSSGECHRLFQPDSTMVASNLQLMKRIYQFQTLESENTGSMTAFLVLDTSAWNKSLQHANSSYLAGDILGAGDIQASGTT